MGSSLYIKLRHHKFLAVLLQRPQSGFLAALILIGAGTQAISAVSVMVWPARLLLIAAGVVNGLALLLWLLSHTTGLPVGLTLWRAEFPSVADMWLPIMEGTAAIFFFSLAARTWSTSSRTLCIIVIALPYLFLLAVLILASLNQVTMAIFFIALLTADGVIPSSRRYSEKD